MKKKTNKNWVNILLYLVIIFAIIFLIKLLYDILLNFQARNFREKKSKSNSNLFLNNNKEPLLSRNFVNMNKPIYNNEYKQNITQKYINAPIPNNGIRVNYYNSGMSLLL